MGAEHTPDASRVVCRFSEPYADPIAPGALYQRPASDCEFFPLHRVVSRDGLSITFETYAHDAPLPPVGREFFFRAWWTPRAMVAALDRNCDWRRLAYPDNGTHEHCLFTWETISAHAGERVGYYSPNHGWVTEHAYRKYIGGDIYRLRGGA